MAQKALKLRAEVEVHSVSCPGVFFQCKGPVHLSICFLGFHVKTKPFPPSFPLLFHDKVPSPLTMFIWSYYSTFETSAKELLFPYPQLRGPYCAGVDVDLLMEPTKDFPGIISPKIEASTRTNIDETRHPEMDQSQDSAHVVSLSPPPIHKHPHLRPRSQERDLEEEKGVFAWRKFDDDLIHRRNKWHTMHHKPGSGRPKSAGPGRMESDSSTERDHHHRSRPRSRARFGANPKHRAHSYTGPRRSGHHPAGPPHLPHHRPASPPHHGLPPHNDLHQRGHSPPCRDTDPVPPCPATHRANPHYPSTPQHCPPTPHHGPPTPHHGPPPTPHHGPPTPHHGPPPTPHHGPPTPHHGPPPTPHHGPPTPHHGLQTPHNGPPLPHHGPPLPHHGRPICRSLRAGYVGHPCPSDPLCYDNFNPHQHCRSDVYFNSQCNYCMSSSFSDWPGFTCHDSHYNANCHCTDCFQDSAPPGCGQGFYSSPGGCGWSCHLDHPTYWPPGPHLHSRSMHH